ncbi:MAG: hypothetical protein ABSA84_06780 [Gammaproteobacteria bacterium]|jgi:hypothetical protein
MSSVYNYCKQKTSAIISIFCSDISGATAIKIFEAVTPKLSNIIKSPIVTSIIPVSNKYIRAASWVADSLTKEVVVHTIGSTIGQELHGVASRASQTFTTNLTLSEKISNIFNTTVKVTAADKLANNFNRIHGSAAVDLGASLGISLSPLPAKAIAKSIGKVSGDRFWAWMVGRSTINNALSIVKNMFKFIDTAVKEWVKGTIIKITTSLLAARVGKRPAVSLGVATGVVLGGDIIQALQYLFPDPVNKITAVITGVASIAALYVAGSGALLVVPVLITIGTGIIGIRTASLATAKKQENKVHQGQLLTKELPKRNRGMDLVIDDKLLFKIKQGTLNCSPVLKATNSSLAVVDAIVEEKPIATNYTVLLFNSRRHLVNSTPIIEFSSGVSLIKSSRM